MDVWLDAHYRDYGMTDVKLSPPAVDLTRDELKADVKNTIFVSNTHIFFKLHGNSVVILRLPFHSIRKRTFNRHL